MNRIAFLASMMCLGSLASAQIATFDFEGEATGSYTSLSMTNGGVTVTITRSGGHTFAINDLTPPAASSWGNRTLDPFTGNGDQGDFFVASFSGAVDAVTIRFSDYFGDEDHPFMEAFSGVNGTGLSLGLVGATWLSSQGMPADGFLTVSNQLGIRSITFGNSFSDNFNTSLYWDNLVLRGTNVPGPAAVLPFALGLLARRRRKA